MNSKTTNKDNLFWIFNFFKILFEKQICNSYMYILVKCWHAAEFVYCAWPEKSSLLLQSTLRSSWRSSLQYLLLPRLNSLSSHISVYMVFNSHNISNGCCHNISYNQKIWTLKYFLMLLKLSSSRYITGCPSIAFWFWNYGILVGEFPQEQW